jgi:hypothetical protein
MHRHEGSHVTRWRLALPVLRTFVLALAVTTTAAVSSRAHAEDTLLLTNGMRTGSVEGCAGDVCTFDGAPVPRTSIYYIGLDAELPPPTPQDPIRDEVHLRDGSIHPGPLVSIDADNVVTEGATHQRKEVAWIWLTPRLGGQGQAAPAPIPEEEGPTYEWNGTVTVENRYSGEAGRHLWKAEYRVKFLEVPDGATPGGDGTDYPSAAFIPLDLAYGFHADQNWDRGAFTLQTNAAGEIIYADVTMRGAASGRLGGERMRDGGRYGRYGIYGNMVQILTPLPATQEVPESLASGFDYTDYSDKVSQPVEPGWYVIWVGRFPYESPQERRAYYRGIERGGREPPFFPDPDEDFLHWIPSHMDGAVAVIGRLDHPDQAEVRGRHTYPEQGPGGSEDRDRERITIEWSFTRTRVPDQP